MSHSSWDITSPSMWWGRLLLSQKFHSLHTKKYLGSCCVSLIHCDSWAVSIVSSEGSRTTGTDVTYWANTRSLLQICNARVQFRLESVTVLSFKNIIISNIKYHMNECKTDLPTFCERASIKHVSSFTKWENFIYFIRSSYEFNMLHCEWDKTSNLETSMEPIKS